MKLTLEQKVRRDCLPKYLQDRFDHINSLIHFIDLDYELFCMEEAVKISSLCNPKVHYIVAMDNLKNLNLSDIHSIQSLIRSCDLSNDYLNSFNANRIPN